MGFFENLPVWLLAVLIFGLRIVDVSLGTVRIIAVVQGWIKASVLLGFVEVLVWLAAASQVIVRIEDSPVLLLAFAAGYAAGNGAGILIERALALGTCVVRIISCQRGEEIAAMVRAGGHRATTFQGRGRDGPRTLVYVICSRRELGRLVRKAREVDPGLFYAVERAVEASTVPALVQVNGWRWAARKK
jgi:uncharacterized protein YebE (UPF0316 family)